MYKIVFILCTWIVLVYSNNLNGTHTGLLNKECVEHYNNLYVSRSVPPRTYQYFHENQQDPSGDTPIQFRIVGGQQVSIEEVPYTVLYGMYCGGAIIAPDWVITAAHCKTREKFVHAGSTQRHLATPYAICAHFLHPLWDAQKHNHDYDYQLVLLENPIPVTPQSRPIAIGTTNQVQTGEVVAVSGWGHVRHKEKMQDIIRRVYVPILDYGECKSLPQSDYQGITPRMFCAGLWNGTKDSCQGDSGGPAANGGFLVGLVSFGVGCAVANQPGVYTNVPLGRDWIRHITALPL